MASEHRHTLPSGHRLGRYRIERYLGAGTFGITYAAYDEDLGRRVAVKEYLPSEWAVREADDSVVVKTKSDEGDFRWGLGRFTEEARSLARFSHPNIVGVYEHFTAHGTAYLVMEYVEGETLEGLLRRKGTLTEAEIEQSVLPVLTGLEFVHEAGMLHRDIKPGNIVLRRDGMPVLIDFGAARQAVGARTRAVTSLVTHGYSPLEQYSTSTRQTTASDLYAFCAVLYRCIAGRAPTDATDRALGTALVSPQEAAAEREYSDGLLQGIEKGLALKTESRPYGTFELRSILSAGSCPGPHHRLVRVTGPSGRIRWVWIPAGQSGRRSPLTNSPLHRESEVKDPISRTRRAASALKEPVQDKRQPDTPQGWYDRGLQWYELANYNVKVGLFTAAFTWISAWMFGAFSMGFLAAASILVYFLVLAWIDERL